MNFYETIAILRQDTSIHGVKSITDEFKTILTNMGGDVVKHEYWGLRQLAYPINRNKRGHYVMLCIKASPDAVAELERQYKIKENVIRFMTLKVNKFDSGPSLMIQSQVGEQETEVVQPKVENKKEETKKEVKDA
jgi:small subunit ribosomal protein S6